MSHLLQKIIMQTVFILILIIIPIETKAVGKSIWQLAEKIDIETVPSSFPVGFSLLTYNQDQYAAYYNEKHEMTVATRKLNQKTWKKMKLDSKIGWDSHNYITMEFDKEGHLHLAGNMHCVPLVYFRTEIPGDIKTLKRFPMTGNNENKCTYPHFIRDAKGRLIFNYRSGRSGNGKRIYNIYNPKSQTWSRLLKSPLFDGEGQRNAYPVGPKTGPDKRFHVLWVWRDSSDCATNNNLSYARSDDLIHWENAAGKPITLPITLAEKSLIVDPVPSGGGIINGGSRLVFDSQNRPMILYHKSDSQDHMQIYVTQFKNGHWKQTQLTNWNKPVKFSGGGSMPFIGIRISKPVKIKKHIWAVNYHHRDYGRGRISFNESSPAPLKFPIGQNIKELPRELNSPEIALPKIKSPKIKPKVLHTRRAYDLGNSNDPNVRYILKWDVLTPNHDHKPTGPLPPPSMLRLYKLVRNLNQ